MEKIKVTCDSTCDLTPELYEQYGVQVLPLGITLGEELHYDSVDVTAEDLFAFADRTGTLPKTSALSPLEYEKAFRPWVEQGYTVIHINISSEFSSCHQNACLAAAELGNVYPIDSRNLSSGSGHLVLLSHILIFIGKQGEAYRLHPFGAGELVTQVLLVLSIAVHVLTNIRPLMTALGARGWRDFFVDILLVLSVLLFFAGIAFLVYFFRWQQL